MPSSHISFLSTSGNRRSEMAYAMAKESANQEIRRRIQDGLVNPADHAGLTREYNGIYSQEYYKFYAQLMAQEQHFGPSRIVYLNQEDHSKRKYYQRHTVARFCRGNRFIQAHRRSVTVSRIIYPLDRDVSLETREAFLTKWPGPLSNLGEHSKQRVADYINVLLRHDSQRHLRYSGTCDQQRKTILKILITLLHRNGFISAPDISAFLLDPDQIHIKNDDKPIETLKKHLLLGERLDAINFAKSKKLWVDAISLANLDMYQPPNSIPSKENTIIQLLDEYITDIKDETLNLVYRSLLNRIISNEPQSVRVIKHPNVGNKFYEFAILSANDCDMEFDETNEIFKLIVAVKKIMLNPHLDRNHLISLGYFSVDNTVDQSGDLNPDLSYQSHVSFKQGDTYASKTLTISNNDLLILNEVWEYCLNLAKGTCNPAQYEYIVDLIPYKLVFASRLLDFGLYDMFASYLNSIRNALVQSRNVLNKDPFYDWDTIERCVEYLGVVWSFYPESEQFTSPPLPLETDFHQQPPSFIAPPRSYSPPLLPPLPAPVTNQPTSSSSFEEESHQPLSFNPPPTSYNPPPSSYNPPPPSLPMTNMGVDNSASSANNDFMDSPHAEEPPPPSYSRVPPPMFYQQPIQEEEDSTEPEKDSSPSSPPFDCPISPVNQSEDTSQSNSGGPGFFNSLRTALMPRNNSKQMILPDDSNPNIYYDEEKRRWVDKTQPESAENDMNDAPPVMDAPKTTNYSFNNRTSRARYPKAGP